MQKLLILLVSLSSVFPARAQDVPIQITADLTEAARHLYHAEIDLPVKPGPATFTTPLWLPASHQPNGSLASVTGVVFTANGQALDWRRDDLALAEFHVAIPEGVTSVHVHLDAIAGRTTRNIGMLEWESLLLYPAHVPVRPPSSLRSLCPRDGASARH